MPHETIKKAGIILALALLTVSAFLIRLDNFKNSKVQSIDEVVYYRMAKQILQEGPSGYNTIPYGQELAATGRPLPDYFFQPLFKYPPLFTFLVALSMKVFGINAIAAAYVPLLLGALTIPLVYILGRAIFGTTVGLIAAFLLWMDPVSIICAQKVWMETTLAFFTVLSILLFTLAITQRKNICFIFSGIACGLATLTKYPGILCAFSYLLFAGIYNKDLFKNKNFWVGISVPFIMLVPWIMWGIQVFGAEFIWLQMGSHSSTDHQKKTLVKILVMVLVILVLYGYYRMRLKNRLLFWQEYDECQRNRLRWVLGLSCTIILIKYLLRSVQIQHLPLTGWQQGLFMGEPPIFYLGQLIEFSLLYLLAYLAFFVKSDTPHHTSAFLKTSIITILGFYMIWENYQSRYILAAIPLLLILTAFMLRTILLRIMKMPSFRVRNVLLTAFLLIVSYALIKTYLINAFLSFPNDLCYF